MKKIVLDENYATVELSCVGKDVPIIAKKNGRIEGMLFRESMGWVLRYPMGGGVTGIHTTRRKCIKASPGYEFFI